MNILEKINQFDAVKLRCDELEALHKQQADKVASLDALEKALESAAAENKTLAEQNSQLAAAMNKAASDLAAEKAAHEATKKAVDIVASQKAATILGASGSAPVESKPGQDGSKVMARGEFSKLSAFAQSQFIKSGGKLTE